MLGSSEAPHLRAPAPQGLAPDFRGDLDDQPELGPLLLLGQDIALDRRGEAALWGEAELLDRRVLRCLFDPPLELVLRLELAGALVVPLHEEPVDLELVEERLSDEVVASLRRPGGTEVAAAHVRRDA